MSISQEIRAALLASDEPLDTAELLERCKSAQSTTDVAAACYAMHKSGAVTRERDETSNRYRYRINPGGPTEDPPENEDASEARASRATPSRKSNGSSPRTPAQQPAARRSAALPLVPGKAPSALPTRAARVTVAADLQIAITEAGVLALRRGEAVMYLSPEEQARIEAFAGRFRTVT
jgi:hypothetical protein